MGAFASRTNAERAAARYREQTKALNLGEPRIVARKGVGPSGDAELYLVQVGAFKSQQEADAARGSLVSALASNSQASRTNPVRPFVAPAFAAVSE